MRNFSRYLVPTCCTWSNLPSKMADQQGTKPPTARCTRCKQFLHKWNTHDTCCSCSVALDNVCAPDRTCSLCIDWPEKSWARYQRAIDKVRDKVGDGVPLKARRKLDCEASPAPSCPPNFGWHLSRHPKEGSDVSISFVCHCGYALR